MVLLDGATSPTPRERDGGWHSRHLAAELTRLDLADDHDLADDLARAIARLAAEHGLTPGNSPSSTVAITRWTDTAVDVLVLADSPVVVFTDTGVEVVADHRLRDLRGQVDRITDWRNRENGWWVAEAEPAAAHRAVRASWPRDRVRAVLMATDGVSCGVDDYGLFADWRTVLDITSENGPEAVLDEIRAAEAGDAGSHEVAAAESARRSSAGGHPIRGREMRKAPRGKRRGFSRTVWWPGAGSNRRPTAFQAVARTN